MKLLALRFSAFGDVAMTIPVIDSLARHYPELEITVLSRPFMQPLFAGMPTNVCFKGIDLSHYEGLAGLLRLFRQLRKEGYQAVADLHDVLRTKVLRTLFRLTGVPVAYVNKGRQEKKALTREKDKMLMQLPTSFARYEEVFRQLGYPIQTDFRSIFGEGKGNSALFHNVTLPKESGKYWTGIAPFAAHKGKMLPEATITSLIGRLASCEEQEIFLFGGEKEKELLEQWADSYPNVHSTAGKLKLNEELSLISHLDVMVSMDSANMHLASLTNTPVVSVWGATHPFAGFMGWKQSLNNAVQTDLPCRPCSIFGNKTCLRGDYACLTSITPQAIIDKITDIIKHKEKQEV